MTTLTIVESSRTLVVLDNAAADELRELGQRLASRQGWWGQDDEESAAERTVVSVQPAGDGRWWLRVSDCVGVLSVQDVQISVLPKIPVPHLLYLFALSGEFPRLDEQRASVESAASLWEVVATWFVSACERLLRRDLLRDYEADRDELLAIRGRVDPLATGHAFYAGRLGLVCDFEEFGLDTSLNRVLKAAAAVVTASSPIPRSVRRRAVRVLSHLQDVGGLQHDDVRVQTDRRSAHYADAITLARHILGRHGRTLAHGTERAWAFLIRTPEMVEQGIRRLLASELGVDRVRKGSRHASGSTLTFNPDLVFDGGDPIGDVKYKLSTGEWPRPDLYQAIAFAEAFGASRALIIRFRGPGTAELPDLVVGQKTIREITWVADPEVSAHEAGKTLTVAVRSWLDDDLLPLSA